MRLAALWRSGSVPNVLELAGGPKQLATRGDLGFAPLAKAQQHSARDAGTASVATRSCASAISFRLAARAVPSPPEDAMVVQDQRDQQPRRGREELSYAVLVRGRERVRDALEPHLGAQHALERANNIVQALALDDVEPQRVALEMLRHVPEADRQRLANLVTRAWLADVSTQ
jgi:hypothetical protein